MNKKTKENYSKFEKAWLFLASSMGVLSLCLQTTGEENIAIHIPTGMQIAGGVIFSIFAISLMIGSVINMIEFLKEVKNERS